MGTPARGMPPKGNTAEWYTRRANFAPLNEEFGFTLDACAASSEAAKVPRFFCPPGVAPRAAGAIAADGLAQSWRDERVWCNPGPYDAWSLARWAKKCAEEADHGAELVVLAVPAWTDRGWWQDFIEPARLSGRAEVRLPRGRWRFGWPGCLDGLPGCGGKFPQALIIWRQRAQGRPITEGEVVQHQVALQREREARIRAESELAGFLRAVELLAGRLHLITPVTRDNVTGASVTREEKERRKRELARARQKAFRLRKRSVTGQRDSVTPEEEKKEKPSPRLSPPSSSERRGALTLVTVAPRDSVRDKPCEHRTPDTLPQEVQALRVAWNELVAPHGFPAWGERTPRQLVADARTALDRRPLSEWRQVFALVPRSPVCRGELGSRQKASLMWLLAGQCADGYEPADKLLSGAWSLDPEPEAPLEEPGASMCREHVAPGVDSEAEHVWGQVQGELRAEGRSYALRQLERVAPVAVEQEVLVLQCPDGFYRAWVEEHYGELLREQIARHGYAGVRFTLGEGGAP